MIKEPQLNLELVKSLLPLGHFEKFPGTKYSAGNPDIWGHYNFRPVYIEGKMLEWPKRDNSPMSLKHKLTDLQRGKITELAKGSFCFIAFYDLEHGCMYLLPWGLPITEALLSKGITKKAFTGTVLSRLSRKGNRFAVGIYFERLMSRLIAKMVEKHGC